MKRGVKTGAHRTFEWNAGDRPLRDSGTVKYQKRAPVAGRVKFLADDHSLIRSRIANKYRFAAQIRAGSGLINIRRAAAPACVNKLIEELSPVISRRGYPQHPEFVAGVHGEPRIDGGEVGGLRIPQFDALNDFARFQIQRHPNRASG